MADPIITPAVAGKVAAAVVGFVIGVAVAKPKTEQSYSEPGDRSNSIN